MKTSIKIDLWNLTGSVLCGVTFVCAPIWPSWLWMLPLALGIGAFVVLIRMVNKDLARYRSPDTSP